MTVLGSPPVADTVAKVLVAVHRRVDRHPRVQRRLATLATRSVGERRVNATISEITQPGDCVWDIGANVGLYTRQFLDGVGPSGHVVAFEPVPENAAELRRLLSCPRLTVVEAALGDSNGHTMLVVSGRSGETSHIAEGSASTSTPDGLDASSNAVTVRVARGDSMLEAGIPAPDVVKIDVEGFERDVLDGLPVALRTARHVVIEVHFAAMAQRSRPDDVLRILEVLRGHGFSLRWLDTSHLLATR
jgi:FkbM family methyltransferase